MTPISPTARRSLDPRTRAFLGYLQKNPTLRNRIRAAPDCSVAYAGSFPDGAAWERLLRRQLSDPGTNDFQMLPDVLRLIPCPADLYTAVGVVTPPQVRTLLDYVNFLTGERPNPPYEGVPWNDDGFIIWRALSGIFMSNAIGRVRLMIGDAPNPGSKVFYRTEIFVLDRNPNIDVFALGAVHQLRTQLKAGVLKGTVELM